MVFNATFNNVADMMDNVMTSFLLFNATFNNVAVMMDNVMTSFIGI